MPICPGLLLTLKQWSVAWVVPEQVAWVSQYPAEQELLFPPGTSLTVFDEQRIGAKRCMSVRAGVSTQPPDVSWCDTVDSKPDLRRPELDEVGPLVPVQLDLAGGPCELRICTRSQFGYQAPTKDFTVHLKATGTVLKGQLSEMSAITREHAAREAFNIPANAESVAFAYPIGRPPRSEHARADEAAEGVRVEIDDALWDSFVRGGGFVYFRSNVPTPLAVTAFKETQYMPLDGPHPLPEGLRTILFREAKVHTCTLLPLHKVGIRKFCYLRPPTIGSEDPLGTVRDRRHGAFCYFYDEPFEQFDCFFVIEDPVARMHKKLLFKQ